MNKQISSQWCLVGNVKDKRTYGQNGLEEKFGTKHYSAGTKVFCLPAQWGDAYEKVVVVGRHRGCKKFSKMIIRSNWITNWRAKVVYSPAVIRLLTQNEYRSWTSEQEVRRYIEALKESFQPKIP